MEIILVKGMSVAIKHQNKSSSLYCYEMLSSSYTKFYICVCVSLFLDVFIYTVIACLFLPLYHTVLLVVFFFFKSNAIWLQWQFAEKLLSQTYVFQCSCIMGNVLLFVSIIIMIFLGGKIDSKGSLDVSVISNPVISTLFVLPNL